MSELNLTPHGWPNIICDAHDGLHMQRDDCRSARYSTNPADKINRGPEPDEDAQPAGTIEPRGVEPLHEFSLPSDVRAKVNELVEFGNSEHERLNELATTVCGLNSDFYLLQSWAEGDLFKQLEPRLAGMAKDMSVNAEIVATLVKQVIDLRDFKDDLYAKFADLAFDSSRTRKIITAHDDKNIEQADLLTKRLDDNSVSILGLAKDVALMTVDLNEHSAQLTAVEQRLVAIPAMVTCDYSHGGSGVYYGPYTPHPLVTEGEFACINPKPVASAPPEQPGEATAIADAFERGMKAATAPDFYNGTGNQTIYHRGYAAGLVGYERWQARATSAEAQAKHLSAVLSRCEESKNLWESAAREVDGQKAVAEQERDKYRKLCDSAHLTLGKAVNQVAKALDLPDGGGGADVFAELIDRYRKIQAERADVEGWLNQRIKDLTQKRDALYESEQQQRVRAIEAERNFESAKTVALNYAREVTTGHLKVAAASRERDAAVREAFRLKRQLRAARGFIVIDTPEMEIEALALGFPPANLLDEDPEPLPTNSNPKDGDL